jgi:outer membrane receptor protein involved in Fe transport
VHDGIALEQLSIESVRNADKGHIDGVELAVYEPFSFLPEPFNRFGLDANITFIRSEVTVATRAGEDFPFFRQPDLLCNLTLFYETPRFSALVAWRYEDDQLDLLGAGRINDIWRKARGQLDAQIRWRFAPAWALTLALRNLTSEPEEFSYGYKNLMRTSRLLQRDLRLALEWQL